MVHRWQSEHIIVISSHLIKKIPKKKINGNLSLQKKINCKIFIAEKD
jgi:hypothetical protein